MRRADARSRQINRGMSAAPVPDLTATLEPTKTLKMDTEPNGETSDSTSQDTPEPTQEAPRFKLRDLRPEKDTMGAGRRRFPNAGSEQP
jgi:hypothetical protein